MSSTGSSEVGGGQGCQIGWACEAGGRVSAANFLVPSAWPTLAFAVIWIRGIRFPKVAAAARRAQGNESPPPLIQDRQEVTNRTHNPWAEFYQKRGCPRGRETIFPKHVQ